MYYNLKHFTFIILQVLVVGTNCYSQDVRLHAECPQRGVTAENRNVLATDNTGVPRKY